MPAVYLFDYCMESVEFCCGVQQVGSFQMNQYSEFAQKRYGYKGEPSPEAAVAKAWDQIKQNGIAEGCPLQFWFVRPDVARHGVFDDDDDVEPNLEEKFENDELRQLVKNHPGVIKLGCFVNPNTDNHVDGYMITEWATKGEELA